MNTAAPAPPAATPRTRWHRLRVTEVRHLTADTVAVTLHVPAALRQDFTHRPGQHVIVRHRQGGGELRRCYSLCPPPYAPTTLRLVIGRGSPDGFGTYAATRLTPGDHLELSAPTGAFALPDLPGAHHVLLAGGTGITPLAPMAAHALRRDPACRVTLVHSARTAADALLADELAELKDEFVDRFTELLVLTREDRGNRGGPLAGRLDAAGLRRLLAALDARPGPDTAYALCGPPGLVDTARRVLAETGADPTRVCWELFTAGDTTARSPEPTALQPASPPPARGPAPESASPAPGGGEARVTALLDGRRRTATVQPHDPFLLDALLRAHPDVPYACREGVCGSCRARVLSGQVAADRQHALDARERAAGYTLVCRARPRTPELTLDFDA
ncbi:2Fe-2S iron-sulfur cluster-binding protein [Streptomyces griseosporeus]|uniref:2Fe-2S iron-sulfur cluster-binding protein n=1 Tax=Streptomyces griseosporeus TaxID=1910 RepID=UPI00167D7BF4|nr:2Fe-2S iron-sulfur cluster-binding protein [Streptomyces griseosporeus]GHF50779.1 putative phenylacetic acid degradation protein PaaE/phenylacetate-CoA oxygenase/reductase, PaaK subunit [Streptomyces griseosporeus]